jgi:hypothetical protein
VSTADEVDVGLAEALGAFASESIQILTLYVPNKDRDGHTVGDHERWVKEAASLLARIGGGVTVMPPCRGGWLNPSTNNIVWEEPILVYTYVKPDEFLALLPELKSFLHRMGRETNQGEIAVEFDGAFYRIGNFEFETVGG